MDFNTTTRFGKAYSGWWFGVWQGERLVGFGAGYKRKARCFAHQKRTYKSAMKREMPTVECINPHIEKRSPEVHTIHTPHEAVRAVGEEKEHASDSD